jgi:nucleotide-binding universal stress UspA family protein
MLRSILVPLDGSPFAEHALPLAFSIAKRTAATVHLLRVPPSLADLFFWAPTPGDALESQLLEHYRQESRAYLDHVIHDLALARGVTVTSATREGEIADAIRTYTADVGADLVVMTTHGRGMLERIWLGSVADELVRSLTIPVILVRPRDTAARLDQEVALRHIVVALDGSGFAEKILEPALAVGSAMGADYTLLRVVSSVPHLSLSHRATSATPPSPEVSNGIKKIEERLRQDAVAYLEKIAAQLRGRGAKVQVQVEFSERPAAAILADIATSADMVALETHGRHGLPRLLLGSVTDKVVRGSSLPILVCRATEGEVAGHSSRNPTGKDGGQKPSSAGS